MHGHTNIELSTNSDLTNVWSHTASLLYWGVKICVGSEVTLEFPGWHEASYILTAHMY